MARVLTLSESCEAPRQVGIRIKLDKPAQELDNNDITHVSLARIRHGAICLVNQDLSPPEFMAFSERFGPIPIQATPNIICYDDIGQTTLTGIGNVRPDGSVIDSFVHGEAWHQDGVYWQFPHNYIITLLHAKILPDQGGSTGFLDLQNVYRLLPDDLKARLHKGTFTIPEDDDGYNIPAATHGTIITHPATKQLFTYVPDPKVDIFDATSGEFMMTRNELVSEIEKLTTLIEHKWEKGDLLIWDNLQVMHRSMGGYGNKHRLLHRCQVRLPHPE